MSSAVPMVLPKKSVQGQHGKDGHDHGLHRGVTEDDVYRRALVGLLVYIPAALRDRKELLAHLLRLALIGVVNAVVFIRYLRRRGHRGRLYIRDGVVRRVGGLLSPALFAAGAQKRRRGEQKA